MKFHERVLTSLLIAGLCGFATSALIRAFSHATCSTFVLGENRNDIETSALIGGATVFAIALAIAFALIRNDMTTKFDKIIVLTLSMFFVLWIAAISMENSLCHPNVWRGYFPYLVVPSMAGFIAIVGRHWIEQND